MKNLRKSLLILFALVAFGPTAWAQFSGGTGTEADPYLISSADDWNTLSDNVSNGTHYTGKYFKLTADMHVTTRVSTKDDSFEGTFDGDGHTLDVNYTLFHYLCIMKNAHNTWKGHAFERVCLQHVPQIKAALGISGVQTNVCSWFAWFKGTKRSTDRPGPTTSRRLYGHLRDETFREHLHYRQ